MSKHGLPVPNDVTSVPLQQILSGFSCPHAVVNESLFAMMAIKHARLTVRMFLDRYSGELDRHGHGLTNLFDQWVTGATDSDTVWHPAFGKAWKTVQTSNPGNVLECAGHLALRLSECGVIGDWSLSLSKPLKFLWGGAILPPLDNLTVSVSDRAVRLCGKYGEEHFNFSQLWPDTSPEGNELAPDRSFGLLRPIALLDSAPYECDDSEHLRENAIPSLGPEYVASCQAGLQFLEHNAPLYQLWVEQVLRYVLVLKKIPEYLNSGSVHVQYGMIFLSSGWDPIPTAEMLVHESTHQYKNLLLSLGALEDGSDKRMFYSPAVKTNRSLERILISYHAFGNILLFYRECRKNGATMDNWSVDRMNKMELWVNQLEEPLRNNPAITPLGEALWRPLHEYLHHQYR